VVHHIFVYGTLMRGQCREKCWPHPPLRVAEGVIRARLYDLGAYPAIVEGDDLVRGEVWEMRPEHVEQTLETLDEVEGHAKLSDDLYVRRLVRCQLDEGKDVSAWTYFYALPLQLDEARRIPTGKSGWSCWRSNTRKTERVASERG